MIRRLLLLSLLSSVALSSSASARDSSTEPIPTTREIRLEYQEPSSLKIIWKNTLYGGLLGMAVPLAVNLIADKHAWKVGPGAGVGLLAGMAWGAYDYSHHQSRHLAHLENGRLVWGLPALAWSRDEDESRMDIGLVQARF